VKGGKKVHMTFISKGSGCANSVKIPSLKKSFTLKKGQKRDIVFTPKKGQTVNFACSMNMYKGKVVAK
jgi:plastocyanin domain-containing protein